MKKLLISTTALVLCASVALAQDTMFRGASDPMEIHASDFIGKRVYRAEALDAEGYPGLQPDWEDIGEINDVILSRDGTVDAVLVDVGGFLGMNEHQLAINMDAIRFVSDEATPDSESDYFLVISAPRAGFESAPAYQWDQAMSDTAATDVTGTGTATGTAADTAATDTAATNATATETATDSAATDTVAADAAYSREGYSTVGNEEMTSEMLTGASVYDRNDERVGEVSELIIADDGKISGAIVDVGGFLGIGERPVELQLAELDILRSDAGDDLRLYTAMTKDQMESLPAYNR